MGPVPSTDPPAGVGPDHPMRLVTRQVAFEADGWTPERRRKVADLFDDLAPEWHTRDYPGRDDPLRDALARGLDGVAGTCLEIGSGTGLSTRLLIERCSRVVALDLAREMLLRAPAEAAPRVQADAAELPFADGGIGVLVLVNALLFPAEYDRVLEPGGHLVWVNSRGDQTPIHLPTSDVVAALDEATTSRWEARSSEAGWGTWCVVWRSGAGGTSDWPEPES